MTSGSVKIGRVVAEMDLVRAGMPHADGIGVFLDVYRRVTALVALRVTDGTFQDPAFTEDLDVRFADLFLDVPADLAAAAAGVEGVGAAGRAARGAAGSCRSSSRSPG